MSTWLWSVFIAATCAAATLSAQDALPSKLSIIHVNDVHSHIDQFNRFGTDCKAKPQDSDCGGGYARIKAAVDELQSQHPDNLLLNAGDEFQGTMFYTYYKGEKTAEVVNLMKFDAITIGNHEFDDGPLHLAAYLRNLTVPVICANVNTSIEELSSRLIPYTIIERYGVGIIGVITPETSFVSSPGDDVHFIEPLDVMQDLIDTLHAQGIRRIIALTHIGYGADVQLVRKTRGISLVVGGHSHTFLGDVPNSEGPYPTVTQDLDGVDVPIVTNGKWGFNLGHLEVVFDAHGRVAHYAGQPIVLTQEIRQNRALQTRIVAWKQPFLHFADTVVGFAKKSFSQLTCQITECSIGNLVADSMLEAKGCRVADVALMNSGGIRAGIPAGNVTRGQILTVLPFGSSLVVLPFKGAYLWDVVEGIVSWRNVQTGHAITSSAQVGGMRVRYTSSSRLSNRLLAIDVRDRDTGVYVPLDKTKHYRVCTLDFLAAGGDFWWPEVPGDQFTRRERVDDALVSYLATRHSVSPVLEGRIDDVSVKGRVKAQAELVLRTLQHIMELWVACFGEFEHHGMKVFEWVGISFVEMLEGGNFR